MSKAERKLPFRTLVQAIDRRDFNWLMSQPEEVRKEFSPVTAIRFVSNASDGIDAGYLLWIVNRQVNRHMFDLQKHPDLVYRLLASCGRGKSLVREWLAGPRRSSVDNIALRLLAEHHPEANDGELRLLLSLYSRDEFANLLEACGIEESKDYLKAYDLV